MSDLNDRKDAFEAKFKHDEEFQFKVNIRCSNIFGLWAAEQLGLDGADAEAYAKQVVEADFEEPGHEDVLRKVTKDFGDKGLEITEHTMRAELETSLEKAREQFMDAD